MITALSGTRSDRNTSISSTKLKQQDRQEHVRQALPERVGEVDTDRGLAADVHVERAPLLARRG